MSNERTFEKELTSLINRYSLENGSETPDFILASYMKGCLENFNSAVMAREKWYGREPVLAPSEVAADLEKKPSWRDCPECSDGTLRHENPAFDILFCSACGYQIAGHKHRIKTGAIR